jgi:hypothetical protein
MNLTDFIITTKTLRPDLQEALIKSKEPNSNTFGLVIQSHQPPPHEWVLHQFLSNPQIFFIENENIIPQTIDPVVVTPIPLLTASAEPSNP